jgi:hypothetical protein
MQIDGSQGGNRSRRKDILRPHRLTADTAGALVALMFRQALESR